MCDYDELPLTIIMNLRHVIFYCVTRKQGSFSRTAAAAWAKALQITQCPARVGHA